MWDYLDEPMRDLLRESKYLLEQEKEHLKTPGRLPLHDYSFVVFPASKAYEGFLKKLFFDLKLINRQQYEGDRFRIGRSLNPNLPARYKWDWVYSKLANTCGGEAVPAQMWRVWKEARNRIFHFFPGHSRFLSLKEAEGLIGEIERVMVTSLTGCGILEGTHELE